MRRAAQLVGVALLVAGCSDSASGVPGGNGELTGSSGPGGSGSAATNASSASGLGAAGGGGAVYAPQPIPEIDPQPPAPCPAQTPSGYFQFLDDTCGAKVWPSEHDRDRACPTVDLDATVALTEGGTVTYRTSDQAMPIDTTALAGIVPEGLTMMVILIRRVDGVPHYRYLSTGDHDAPYQPWSTTKFLAAANGAANLRAKSDYQVGLTGSVAGIPLGDLVTSIHNYDNAPYGSNGLGRYFHDIGGRARANDLIHDLWLERSSSETFGGNYGAAAPALGYTFVDGAAQVTLSPDTSAGPANYLSSFTIADALKRLVLHREEPAQRLPGIQWADLRVLLFGAEASTTYGPWGGMAADTAIYLQTGHDMDYIEARSRGQWSIASKLGLGTSGQFLNVGYACFPVLDDASEPVPGWGREFVIAAHLATGGASWADRDRLLATAYRAVITRVVDGRL